MDKTPRQEAQATVNHLRTALAEAESRLRGLSFGPVRGEVYTNSVETPVPEGLQVLYMRLDNSSTFIGTPGDGEDYLWQLLPPWDKFKCTAHILHGAGYQSKSFCERKDPHETCDEHYAGVQHRWEWEGPQDISE
jgi:hypothetical protein